MISGIKDFIISVFFLTIVVLISCKTSNQVITNNNLDENRTVYWFYVKLREAEINNSGVIGYNITRLGNTIESGSAKQYDYLLWKYLSEGSKFAIGPFNDPEEAKQAFIFYKIQNEAHQLDADFNQNAKVYWFVLQVNFRERTKSMELQRIPGAIASGTYIEFDAFLRDNLSIRVMTVGPFRTMPDAEESKRIYRLH